jgi:hypothetical protein
MSLSDHNGKDEFEIDFTGFKKRSDSNIYERLPKKDLIGGFISSNVYFELSGADIDTEAELPFRNLDLSKFINTKKALVFLKISGEYTEDINDAIIARPAGDENYKVDKVLNNNLIGGIGNSFVDKDGQGNYIICPTNNEGKIEVIAPKGLVEIRLVGYIPKISHIVDILSDHGQPAGAGPHKEGALVNISVSPDPGYSFSNWTVLSGNVSVLRNSFVMPAEDVFLRANFNTIKYTVTVTGTNGSPSGSGTYTIDEIVSLSPNPDTGYGFVRWEIDPSSISISNNKFTMPASDVTVTAIYDAIKYTVTVTAKDNAGDPTGSGQYFAGEEVVLSPEPKEGYTFRFWTSSLIITDNKFIMPTNNVEVIGHYTNVYTVTVYGENGAPSGGGEIAFGDTVNLVPNPNDGYQFVRWEVESGDVTIEANSFTMPPRNVRIKAVFKTIETTFSEDIYTDKDGRAHALQVFETVDDFTERCDFLTEDFESIDNYHGNGETMSQILFGIQDPRTTKDYTAAARFKAAGREFNTFYIDLTAIEKHSWLHSNRTFSHKKYGTVTKDISIDPWVSVLWNEDHENAHGHPKAIGIPLIASGYSGRPRSKHKNDYEYREKGLHSQFAAMLIPPGWDLVIATGANGYNTNHSSTPFHYDSWPNCGNVWQNGGPDFYKILGPALITRFPVTISESTKENYLKKIPNHFIKDLTVHYLRPHRYAGGLEQWVKENAYYSQITGGFSLHFNKIEM